MIARLREEAREGHSPRRAAELGVQHAGPTVAAAGGILAGTFGVLVLSPMSFLAQIGFGVAIGILLSAFVMSAFLVPGITAMLGHRAWWPGHGDVSRKTPRPPPASVSVEPHCADLAAGSPASRSAVFMGPRGRRAGPGG